jgi:hypothetical protein
VVGVLAQLDRGSTDTARATNLLTNLFAAGELAAETDVYAVLEQWSQARQKIAEARGL